MLERLRPSSMRPVESSKCHHERGGRGARWRHHPILPLAIASARSPRWRRPCARAAQSRCRLHDVVRAAEPPQRCASADVAYLKPASGPSVLGLLVEFSARAGARHGREGDRHARAFGPAHRARPREYRTCPCPQRRIPRGLSHRRRSAPHESVSLRFPAPDAVTRIARARTCFYFARPLIDVGARLARVGLVPRVAIDHTIRSIPLPPPVTDLRAWRVTAIAAALIGALATAFAQPCQTARPPFAWRPSSGNNHPPTVRTARHS